MFELGMRLAFNKPVVIIKDDKTDYSFDTSNIQHENYRKDLRHNTVEKFIIDLSKKIKKTYEASLKTDYQSFLSYFGKFEVAKIENKPIGESEAIEKLLNKFSTLDSKITKLFHDNSFKNENLSISNNVKNIVIDMPDYIFTIADIAEINNEIKKSIFVVDNVSFKDKKLLISFISPIEIKEVAKIRVEIDNIIANHFLPF